MLPGNECAMLKFAVLYLYLTSGVVKPGLKHSAAYKLNQQINGTERKGKKRSDSGMALNSTPRRVESSPELYNFLQKQLNT